MRDKIIDLLYAENVRSDCGIERLADEICTIAPARWIPVIERLPTIGKEVLTYCGDINYIEINSLEKHVGNYHWENQNGDWQDLEGVTAWMPLPEPWRGEENEAD